MTTDQLLSFLLLTDANVRYVVLGSVLLAGSSAVVGCFTLLRKRALVGDAVAHAVLPGVCLAFILSGSKNPFVLLAGAFATGWLSVVLVDTISTRSRIKEDTAIGLVLSVFFGIGILMLTSIQHSGSASQSGLDRFLFGKAAALVGTDLLAFSLVAVALLLLAVWLLYKELKLLAFDEAFARSIGLPVKTLQTVLTSLTVLAVVVGIQAVGVVLMAAMLITPAAAARYLTHKLWVMLWLAALLGAFSGYAGAFISYVAPAMPTGPWIVVVISTLAMLSFLFAPKRGIVARMQLQRAHQQRVLQENILKLFYHLSEADASFFAVRQVQEVAARRSFRKGQLEKGLSRPVRNGYLEKADRGYRFTAEGKAQGQRVVRLHRLWELYLTQHLRLTPDHVHEDAESMEHILTPELEDKLQQLLNYPTLDPHDEQIPYK